MRTSGRLWLAAGAVPPLVVLGVFFGLPVAGILARGLWPDGVFDPAGAWQTLVRPRTARVVWFTLWSAAAGTLLSVLAGLPLAYALYRLTWPGVRVARAALLVPFVLPTVVVGVAFRQLLRPTGPAGFLGLDGTPAGIVAALAFFNICVVARAVGAAWAGLDPRLGDAAASLGATKAQVLRTVTLPMLRPAIISSASVVFLFCSTAFGVVLTMGGVRYATVETEIYLLTTNLLDLQGAAALSLIQIAAVIALLGLTRRVRSHPDTGTGAAARAPGLADLPVLAVSATVGVFLAAPVLALVTGSMRTAGGFGFDHYAALADGSASAALPSTALQALGNTLRTALDATLMSVTMGVLIAVLVTRPSRSVAERRVRGFLDQVFMLPLGVSAVTVGFGFLITLDSPPVDLRDSPLLVPIAQALVALPLVIRTLVPVLAAIDDTGRQAAASLGAGPVHVLRTVDLPVLVRPLVAAAGFAFAVSVGEFGATSFLARPKTPTLPVLIFRLIGLPGQANYGMALAASVLLAATAAGVVAIAERIHTSTGALV